MNVNELKIMCEAALLACKVDAELVVPSTNSTGRAIVFLKFSGLGQAMRCYDYLDELEFGLMPLSDQCAFMVVESRQVADELSWKVDN